MDADSYLHVNILKCVDVEGSRDDVSKIPIEECSILTIVLLSKSMLERAVNKNDSAFLVNWLVLDTYLYVSV